MITTTKASEWSFEINSLMSKSLFLFFKWVHGFFESEKILKTSWKLRQIT